MKPMFDDPIILNLDKLPDDKLLTEKHLAFLLNVSLSKLQKDRVAGNPPRYVKIRGAVRYSLGEYRSFVRGNTVTSTAQADLRGKYAGTEGLTPYARIGSTIYGFLDTLDLDIDEIIVGDLTTFRSMGYEIAANTA
jgi:hypothetical protein